MPAPIYVLGHKNPDSDSICSAVGYAALLEQQEQPAISARQGPVRRETAYILDRFRVPATALVTDVRPRVADVMTSPVTTARHDPSLYEAGQILQQAGHRALPVVGDDGKLAGVIGIEDFARSFLGDLALDKLDYVPLDMD